MKFSEEEKAMWLEDWRGSGKSAWAYAKENGLTPQTFVRWTKSGTEEPPCFVEVTVQMPALAASRHEMPPHFCMSAKRAPGPCLKSSKHGS
jgi:hypothetical protein